MLDTKDETESESSSASEEEILTVAITSGEGVEDTSVDEEKRIVHKATMYLLPFLSFLYLLCFLDRANLGNAHAPMVKDLGISESEYALSVSIFYIGYVIFEVPANCMMELVQARRWLARIMITWGVVSVLLSAVQNLTTLLLLRLLLGVAEAGFFPGAIFYMTKWFTKHERAAGLVGGILAYLIINNLDGALGLRGWRWIFILEGIPSVIMGIVTLVSLSFSLSCFGQLSLI